jgi:hypothetical protein
MLQVSRRRRDLTGVPDSVTEAQPGVGGPESLFGSGLGRRSTMERDLQPARRIRSPSVPPAASHQPANECRSWADAPQAGRRGGPLGDPEDARGVTVPLRPELVLVSTGTTLTPCWPRCEQPEGQGCRAGSGPWRSPPVPGLPDPAAQRCWVHAQRPCDLPDRLARSHRLDPNRPRRGRPRPATLQAARPPGGPWPVRLGCRFTLAAARPPLRAPIRWPCWARRGWPRPDWHRRAQPDGHAGVVGWRPTRSRQGAWAGGRQARPAPQRPPRSAPAQGGDQPRRPAAAPRT